jgi:hypothetical protein
MHTTCWYETPHGKRLLETKLRLYYILILKHILEKWVVTIGAGFI